MEDLIRTLPNLLRAAGDSEEVCEAATMVAWRRVAGEALRSQAVPFRLYRKTLIVAVPDTTWQKQMEAISGQLIFRLNSLLGQAIVTYIEFRVDPKTVQAEREAVKSFVADQAQLEKNALEQTSGALADAAADAIHDEQLRKLFLVAAGSCIARRETDEKHLNR